MGATSKSSDVLLGDMCSWPHAWLDSGSEDAETSVGDDVSMCVEACTVYVYEHM